ncbi:DsbA family protein [Patescibacteria group bacterium]|nr:DsbA family protein [Patescibacteria group bacterium]
MTDKKIIFSAVILSLFLIGGAWYYSEQLPTASISGAIPSSSPSTVALEAGILIGDPNAPVTMEEYTNFLCSACARFAVTTLPQIKEDYVKTGKVKIVIYVLPPYELSQAALCSQEQNKFVEYHDYLFDHQGQITKEDDLKNMAVNAGLDSGKFNACYDSGQYADKAVKWSEEASSRGVESTPIFFINGQKLIGAQPYGDFKKIIDEKLNQAR